MQGIVLDPRENDTRPDDDGHVHLKYPPPVIYFQPDTPTNAVFEGVPHGTIPISPSEIGFGVESVDTEGGRVKVTRQQLAVVPGYAFTDY